MLGEHHRLGDEYPEYRDKIHQLKIRSSRFSQLFDSYNDIDKEIYRIEEEIETPSDDYTEELKKKRLFLKDQIVRMLKEA